MKRLINIMGLVTMGVGLNLMIITALRDWMPGVYAALTKGDNVAILCAAAGLLIFVAGETMLLALRLRWLEDRVEQLSLPSDQGDSGDKRPTCGCR